MTPRVPVQPALLLWACERRGLTPDQLTPRFPKLPAWIDGELHPTLRQLEAFAAATTTPVGYLFLRQPPVETVPIPDMRTMGSHTLTRPSPDLLDTIYLCQQRQDWYRDFARSEGEHPLPFVGSTTIAASVEQTATAMAAALGFDVTARQAMRTWEEALRRFVEQAEDLGVLVMISGGVGTNTHRALDPDEFRGFALCDNLAPVVFLNGKDTKSAQMFTLAHELAHLWAGQSALDDVSAAELPAAAVERWCNRVAAELLVPLSTLRAELHPGAAVEAESRRLARAVCSSTWEGRSSFTEAFRLLNVKKMDTFTKLGRAVGVGQ